MSRARWLTPDSAAGGDLCRVLHIPPELTEIVSGALDVLTDPDNYEQSGDLTPDQTAALAWSMLQNYPEDCPVLVAPTQSRLIYPASLKNVGSADEFVTANNQWLSGVWRSVTPAIGDKWFFNAPCDIGYWKAKWIGRKNQNSGIVEVHIGGLTTDEFDLYNATGVMTVVDLTDFEIAVPATLPVTVEVIGKRAASGGYEAMLSELVIYREV